MCSDETLLSAIASALHTSATPITGQLTAAVEKNPGVWLNTTQPLCKAFVVTEDDIRYHFQIFLFNLLLIQRLFCTTLYQCLTTHVVNFHHVYDVLPV